MMMRRRVDRLRGARRRDWVALVSGVDGRDWVDDARSAGSVVLGLGTGSAR